MTTYEYLGLILTYDSGTIPNGMITKFGDLRAKEAVKEFAEELMLYDKRFTTPSDQNSTVYAVLVSKIKEIAKQKGVEL